MENIKTPIQEFANQAIDDLGGTSAVAEMVDLTTGAVSQWRKNGIPDYRVKYLKLLHPSVFAHIRTTVKEPA